MLIRDGERVHVHPVLEPALLLGDRHVVAAHLPLLHEAVDVISPVLEYIKMPQCSCNEGAYPKRAHLQAVAAVPLLGTVGLDLIPFVEELDVQEEKQSVVANSETLACDDEPGLRSCCP